MQMHPINNALHVSYVPLPVTRGALAANRNTYGLPRSRTFIPLSVSRWNDLADPVFDGVGLACFKIGAIASLFTKAARSLFVFYCFQFLFLL